MRRGVPRPCGRHRVVAHHDPVHRSLLGAARDLRDPRIFHHLSLVAFLAWVGLGADGLSSSAYGPEAAFSAIGEHRYLAVFLALAIGATVFIISWGLTATKLTALQLISFVLREYLPTMPMTPATFAQRVLSVRGRKETSPDHELVVFYETPRDPAVNEALRDACDRLNRRKLQRDDRRLGFAVEPPPARFG